MALADKLNTALANLGPLRPPANVCGLCWVIDQLSDEDREALMRAIDSTIPGTDLAQIICAEGYFVTDRTVQRHRKQGHHVAV